MYESFDILNISQRTAEDEQSNLIQKCEVIAFNAATKIY